MVPTSRRFFRERSSLWRCYEEIVKCTDSCSLAVIQISHHVSFLQLSSFSLVSLHEWRVIKEPRHHVTKSKLATYPFKVEGPHKLDHQKRELDCCKAVSAESASDTTAQKVWITPVLYGNASTGAFLERDPVR
jgi:hypothetical protein